MLEDLSGRHQWKERVLLSILQSYKYGVFMTVQKRAFKSIDVDGIPAARLVLFKFIKTRDILIA